MKPDLIDAARYAVAAGHRAGAVRSAGSPPPRTHPARAARDPEGAARRLAQLRLHRLRGSELEFYLFDENYRSLRDKHYRDPNTAGYYIEDYHIFQTSKEEDVMRAMRNGLQSAGIPVENSKGEWGPGQEELNVRYADALTWPTAT